MTKLLCCESCSDIVSPLLESWRRCLCGRHNCKFDDDGSTLLIFDEQRINPVDYNKWSPGCFVIGLHNDFLMMPVSNKNETYMEYMERLMNDTPDYYLFKQWNSFVVKVFPFMFGNDVKWVEKDG